MPASSATATSSAAAQRLGSQSAFSDARLDRQMRCCHPAYGNFDHRVMVCGRTAAADRPDAMVIMVVVIMMMVIIMVAMIAPVVATVVLATTIVTAAATAAAAVAAAVRQSGIHVGGEEQHNRASKDQAQGCLCQCGYRHAPSPCGSRLPARWAKDIPATDNCRCCVRNFECTKSGARVIRPETERKCCAVHNNRRRVARRQQIASFIVRLLRVLDRQQCDLYAFQVVDSARTVLGFSHVPALPQGGGS
jgi:hypothetical protein